MATINAIVGLLREEVEGRIRDLTPTAFITNPFKPRTSTERKGKKIRECTGHDRLFEMSDSDGVPAYKNLSVGHSNRRIEMRFPIIILYRDTEDWTRAANDDMEAISQDLRRNDSAVTGVEIRQIDYDEVPPLLEPHEADPWLYGVLSLQAHLWVS